MGRVFCVSLYLLYYSSIVYVVINKRVYVCTARESSEHCALRVDHFWVGRQVDIGIIPVAAAPADTVRHTQSFCYISICPYPPYPPYYTYVIV